MKSDKRWLQRQNKDPYVKQARKLDYRSRAVFKLQEIDKRDHLFRPGQIVVDLGAAPGSWSQYAVEKVSPGGRVLAVDILAMQAIEGVDIVQGDFNDDETVEKCLQQVGVRQVDIVISDLAPNLTGIRDTDQARSLELAEQVLAFAIQALRPQGNLLLKVFEGRDVDAFKKKLSERFQKLTVRKPDASRADSREFYILASNLKL